MVRFDDSLPTLINTIAPILGDAAVTSGVALRDTMGKLAFFIREDIDATKAEQISKTIKEALGVYAREDRVIASLSDFGAKSILDDDSALTVTVAGKQIQYLDRRLVGGDWLRRPAPESGIPPRFVFASLKGGVGRSTALCVTAADLARRGLRTLCIDLDMEAPGLGSILLDNKTLPDFGFVDAIVENSLSPIDPSFLADLVGPSALADQRGRIDVVPAFGRRCMNNPSDVLGKLARAYSGEIREDGKVLTLFDQVRAIVEKLADPERYDAVLIDARAGLNEATPAALLGLGAEVFLFGLNDSQTFDGYAALFAHLHRLGSAGEGARDLLDRFVMVHGKAPADPSARATFRDRYKALIATLGPILVRPTESRVPLPAEPFNNVPWDESIGDDELSNLENSLSVEPLAILDDDRFRVFDPIRSRDLVTEAVYQSSFGSFLDFVRTALPTDREVTP